MKTLNELRAELSTQKKCEAYLRKARWPHGVICPLCGSRHVLWMNKYGVWQCKDCHKQFSLTSGTIFHKTHLPLIKWFEAIWLLCNSPKGISAKQIQREVGVTYKVAWRITQQIRKAMKHDVFANGLCGIVEIDESEVKTTGSGGGSDRNTVVGLFERDGYLKMEVVENFKSMTIERVVAKNFNAVEQIFTDGAHWLRFLAKYGEHKFVQHYKHYAVDDVHVNHIENVWSLLKRGIIGVYHHINTKYLQAYLDEFSFRYSHRKNKTSMFDKILAFC